MFASYIVGAARTPRGRQEIKARSLEFTAGTLRANL
jgi:hypothetical protein